MIMTTKYPKSYYILNKPIQNISGGNNVYFKY